jgi:hypothetical protein
MNPQIAQTVVHMGFAITDIVSHRSLRDALQYFLRRERSSSTGLRIKA